MFVFSQPGGVGGPVYKQSLHCSNHFQFVKLLSATGNIPASEWPTDESRSQTTTREGTSKEQLYCCFSEQVPGGASLTLAHGKLSIAYIHVHTYTHTTSQSVVMLGVLGCFDFLSNNTNSSYYHNTVIQNLQSCPSICASRTK